MLNVSDNETYKQLADLLEVARDASVTATTSPNELQIRLRIRRYKLARRQEFDSMKRYWNTKQVSPKLPELILMIVFGLVPRKFPSE